MTSRRVLKAAEAIREVVGMAILTDLKDPRIEHVTVTSVEVSGDMRQAKVRVSIMGDDTKQRLALRGLESSAGYLQSKISDRIDTRYIPKIKFELDEGVKKSIALQKMLSEVLPEELEGMKPSVESSTEEARIEEKSSETPIAEEPSPDEKSPEEPSPEEKS